MNEHGTRGDLTLGVSQRKHLRRSPFSKLATVCSVHCEVANDQSNVGVLSPPRSGAPPSARGCGARGVAALCPRDPALTCADIALPKHRPNIPSTPQAHPCKCPKPTNRLLPVHRHPFETSTSCHSQRSALSWGRDYAALVRASAHLPLCPKPLEARFFSQKLSWSIDSIETQILGCAPNACTSQAI